MTAASIQNCGSLSVIAIHFRPRPTVFPNYSSSHPARTSTLPNEPN